ncbi:dihydrofolate reductase family protein [Actinopolymorpha pittospori]|uniref:Riboflavin biosynthesis protein RibD n=1 Tax=Actinopolymorpha pittospori TaxID=648752 RepID=A0A927RLN8_9ACTN|nr:dihydrofolate reductase family protein [Actinopolymorpha pittospori]MBE1609391.1 5-amino-6-(5-phosphoribosylamino)uracil reductase [Actinopolymorpha pittospori]
MPRRPYVVASAAMSVDGYLDDGDVTRLLLSNDADFDRVDDVRASCDAILVGAETIRRDDPRLLVRSSLRRQARVAAGRPANPWKVTLTGSGDLDPNAAFFTAGEAGRIVYAAGGTAGSLTDRLGDLAVVVDLGERLDLSALLADLWVRGIRRLLVEGGSRIHTEFLTAGLVDELHLVVAPFFVGDPDGTRFVGAGTFPHGPDQRMRLAEVRQIGDVVLARYLLAAADHFWLREAIELSRLCPRTESAYAVGAVIVDAEGRELARGYSRETDPNDHAEEVALSRVPPGDPRLATATLYSSLEPCTSRASRPRPCAELTLAAGIRRVVIAWREPALFVDCHGVEQLREAGAEVVEIPELAPLVREINAHLFTADR